MKQPRNITLTKEEFIRSKELRQPSLNRVVGGQIPMIEEKQRIRKLTPKECFRLQGWSDEKFERAAMVNSDSQLYKQAGNGVTVTVIQKIAERMK